ncbi:hypothetical protein [Tepidimonas charontis]|uniref:Uncharacterized protein n=1 Tax=Tepidimonas charontis TaxID=2267262 RepID=A0A554X8J3_9BURK|nr:hypothetical protein [Tepidimonas charontis]TSE32096.1 hypothetical protein Tchar_02182 [Tepidimonas charontis]
MTDPQQIDLSQDVVDLSCERPIFDVQERLYRRRYEQRRWLFWAAIAAVDAGRPAVVANTFTRRW